MSRNYCYRCFKTGALCVCDVSVVLNRTAVWIVQHPAERTHPINSARLTTLGLERASIQVAWHTECDRPELPEGAVVLFPSHESKDLEELPEAPTGLVVLDGTWSQARKLYKRNPWIQALPHVHLTPRTESRYRIRRQPKAGYLSTLEATVAALKLLEPETTGLDGLLDRFDAMIDVQEGYIRNPPPGAYRHERAADRFHRPPAPPETILNLDRLVLCYGDFTTSRSEGGRVTEPVVLALERFATGERWVQSFSGVHGTPLDEHLHHMGLHPDEYAEAPPSATAGESLRRFLTDSDTLCSWNGSTTRRIHGLLGRSLPSMSLKADYCNWTRRQVGHLEDEVDAIRRLDTRVIAPEQRLRAERRLHCAAEVLRYLERDVRSVLDGRFRRATRR
ncbi:MAG: tRNA-uridine aminocarboxypropyltransferase [Myxococcota bacterium]